MRWDLCLPQAHGAWWGHLTAQDYNVFVHWRARSSPALRYTICQPNDSCHLLKTSYVPVILQPLPVFILLLSLPPSDTIFPILQMRTLMHRRGVNLHKAARLVSGRARIQILVIWLYNLNFEKKKTQMNLFKLWNTAGTQECIKHIGRVLSAHWLPAHRDDLEYLVSIPAKNPIGNQIYSRWFRWRDVNESTTGRGLLRQYLKTSEFWSGPLLQDWETEREIQSRGPVEIWRSCSAGGRDSMDKHHPGRKRIGKKHPTTSILPLWL